MAAGFISLPEAEYGPCNEACAHKDCAESRRIAEAPCRICGDPIGYEKSYFQEKGWTIFVHWSCFMAEVEG